jgi:glucose/arabinose dehydrogenase
VFGRVGALAVSGGLVVAVVAGAWWKVRRVDAERERTPASAARVPPDASSPAAAPTVAPHEGPLERARSLEVLARGQNHPTALALTKNDVLFTAYEDGAVRRVPKRGGSVETLASGFEDAYGIAVGADALVFATRTQDGGIWRLALRPGSAPIRLEAARFPSAVALDGDDVVWATRDAVARASLLGREGARELARGEAGPHAVIARAGLVVWSNYHGGTLRAITRAGETLTLARGLVNPSGLAFAGNEVVVACTGDGTVRAVSLDTHAVRTIAAGRPFPIDVAAREGVVYFTSAGG